jgi:hypothetical protein
MFNSFVRIRIPQYITVMSVNVTLTSLVVIMLAIGPKVHSLNPAKDDGFFRAIKILSMTSFGGEVKSRVI